ncbi:zinc finger protein 22 [Drosophila subpulchrella]|uniref:zinc finger protein 22 n=1 Tax=Drosophila subpulchrella TaxID=1486046 RepID=UPI0018A16C7D|nr:zinc finger protein 22 [Drosophila subpulchrella]
MRILSCRICSGVDAPINLFDPGNGHLIRQIFSITGVELSCKKELSNNMCMVCLGDLQAAIKFRQRCIISEKQNQERAESTGKDFPKEAISHEDIDDELIELELDEAILTPEVTNLPKPRAVPVKAEISSKKPIGNTGPFVCDDCGKSINNRTNFLEHKLRHTGIKDFHCDFGECGKSFATRKELTRHSRIHTGEQPYVCIYCPRRFSDTSSRQEHHRRHRNERRFKCDICEKSFVSAGCLSQHKMTHIAVRKHYCYVCQKHFQRISHLRTHLSTSIHKEKAEEAEAAQEAGLFKI